MSPAQAVVPVERYIGSCLISSVGYKKDRFRYPCLPDYYQPPNWGVPLVAPPPPPQAVARRPKKDKEERSPLSRLAIHTQGAPLIQAQRQSNRKSNKQPPANKAPQPQQTQEESPNENSLPRIIKPRKRRKKDRKPQPSASAESTIVTLKPYTPLCQEFSEEEEAKASAAQKAEEIQQRQQQQQQQLQQQQQQPPPPEPNCCCRYCDPGGSVWDSPLLTGNRTSAEWSTLQVSSEIITSPNGHRDIEIKFFSSPPPQPAQQPLQRPVSVTPPWQ